jgi:sulfate adenylyltransferase subunit 1
MDILRFITAGSVDDGKSTLIGRLLYDTDSILIDQLTAVEKQSKNKLAGDIDLAIITDGLRAEREQGITIDVAYKYFATEKRKFIIADTPGHVQYTRNMVTGASNADLAVILIDARKGVIEQTKRHTLIASLLGIPHIIVAVNKMDLVNFDQAVFQKIEDDYRQLGKTLGLKEIIFVPVSALIGDNIVNKSENMAWYTGDSLLSVLETVEVKKDVNLTHPRFPVQFVLRPQTTEAHDYRGYAGKIVSGTFKKGDIVSIQPSGKTSVVKMIEKNLSQTPQAFAGESVVMHLEDEIDISRGDMIVGTENLPKISQEIEAYFCWMDNKALKIGGKYLLQHNSRTVKCSVKSVEYKLNINTLEKEFDFETVVLNEVGKIHLKTASPLVYDEYAQIRQNGGAILIDETSNLTVAAIILT